MTFPADRIEPLTDAEIEFLYHGRGYCSGKDVADLVFTIRTLKADLAHAVGCSGERIDHHRNIDPCPRCVSFKAELDQKPAKGKK